MAQRSAWRERLKHVDLKRLVFLDESGAKTNMTRLYARSKKGQRALDYAPRGHWSTTTMVAGVTWSAPIAPMVLDGPMDADAFEAYVAQVLAPALPPASIVVMDNLSPHKTGSIEPMIQNAQSELWYLPRIAPTSILSSTCGRRSRVTCGPQELKPKKNYGPPLPLRWPKSPLRTPKAVFLTRS